MPYFISNDNPECSGWAVEKDNGEIMGCHRRRQEAIDQMVALSVAEEIEPGGERGAKDFPDLTPPQGVREEAQRGLDWRSEYGRGGTAVGVARARDLSNGRTLSIDTIRRMLSYFARHEVDKQGEGWSPGEDGYPSNGRIAWALWGGDAGWSWARRMNAAWERELENRRSKRTGTSMNVKRLNAAARFDVKAAKNEDSAGEIVAVVSVFDNVDLTGERVMRGAFSKSLELYKETGRAIPLVWNHSWDTPEHYIGKVTEAEETDEGLVIKADLFDTSTAKHVKTLLASSVVSEFSFAYDIIEESEGKDGVRQLDTLHVLEVGPTLKGANPATRLIGVRSALLGQKAEPGELSEGSYVEWAGGYGRVEYIMTEGEFGVEGDPLSIPASAEDPLALVREYEEEDGEWMPTQEFTAHRFSELSAVEEKAAKSGKLDNPTNVRTAAKAGRVLSSKNETRIKDAVALLQDVLGSLTVDDMGKSEEPAGAKDEATVVEMADNNQTIDGATAKILLEVETELE